MNRLVCGTFLEVKGVGTHDIGCREGKARVVACRDLGGGSISRADKVLATLTGAYSMHMNLGSLLQ